MTERVVTVSVTYIAELIANAAGSKGMLMQTEALLTAADKVCEAVNELDEWHVPIGIWSAFDDYRKLKGKANA